MSGLLFGIWHRVLIQGVYTSIMGLILGYVYYKTGDIRMSMLIHVLNNMGGAIPPGLDTETTQIVLYILNMGMILPMFFLLFRMSKKQK